jgi:signal transduction histidine kinase
MKFKLILLFLFFIGGGIVSGYSVSTDSLKTIIAAGEKNRVDALLDFSDQYLDSIIYYDFVVTCLNEALDSAESAGNDSLQVKIYNYLGLADFNIGNYENSTDYFYKALNILDHKPNVRQKSIVYNNLGMIFDELEDFERALEFYRESYFIDSLANNKEGLVFSYINLGISYQNLKQYERSREYNNLAFELAKELNDSLSMVNVVNNLGTLEYDLENYDESLSFYLQALELYEESGDRAGVAIAKNNIGLIYLDLKDYPKSVENFKTALKIASELNMYDFTGDIYGNLSIYYEEIGDYKNAFEYYDQYNTVYDSLIGEKQELKIRKLETQYQFEKKQREILELQKKNEQQEKLLVNSRSIQNYLYLIILLVVIFLSILFFLLRKERALARELHDKTQELKKLNLSKDRFFSIIAHDLRNPFNALISFTSLLREQFDSFSRDDLKRIIIDLNNATEQGFSLLENLLHWTRSQTNMIKVYNTNFKLKEVVDSILNLAAPNLLKKSLVVEVDMDDELKIYGDKDMIATVIRNLVFNAIKFSYPETTIRIEGKQIGGNIQFSVSDQGVGMTEEVQRNIFDSQNYSTSAGTSGETGSGLGLMICREFIEKNKGVIWVESEEGKGAIFRFSIPVVKGKP